MCVEKNSYFVKELDKKTEREFINTHHKLKYVESAVAFGLFLGNSIVQVMSFGKPTHNKYYQYEILRECTKDDTITNRADILWREFIKSRPLVSCLCCFGNVSRECLSILVSEDIFKKFPISELESCIYYPFGVVYRTDDLDDGVFYIGLCENKQSWDCGYLGSGSGIKEHLLKHPNKAIYKETESSHRYRRIILHVCEDPETARKLECKEIGKFLSKDKDGRRVKSDEKCLNRKNLIQPAVFPSYEICQECGGRNGTHKSGCSRKKFKVCLECGNLNGQHKPTCSRYKNKGKCEYCGFSIKSNKHAKDCPLYSPVKITVVCPYCNARNGRHKKSCPEYTELAKCKECGSIGNRHKKTCPHYKQRTPCPECGGERGKHRKGCSKYRRKTKLKKEGTCPECGMPNWKHTTKCSKYVVEVCQECSGLRGRHRKGCSKYKKKKPVPCPECGGKNGRHYKTCSKSKICPECGYAIQSNHHASWCSNYKKPKKYQECDNAGRAEDVHDRVKHLDNKIDE